MRELLSLGNVQYKRQFWAPRANLQRRAQNWKILQILLFPFSRILMRIVLLFYFSNHFFFSSLKMKGERGRISTPFIYHFFRRVSKGSKFHSNSWFVQKGNKFFTEKSPSFHFSQCSPFEMILWKQIAFPRRFQKARWYSWKERKEVVVVCTFYMHKNSSKSVAFISSPSFCSHRKHHFLHKKKKEFLNRESLFFGNSSSPSFHPFGVTKMNLVDRKTLLKL